MAIKTKVKRNVQGDSVLLDEAFDGFIFEKESNNLAPETIKNYQHTYKRFCEFYGFNSDTITEEITQDLVFKWIGTMKLDELSFNSINHHLRDIRTFLYWCMDDARKYIEPSFKIQLVKGQEEPPKAFADGDLEILLEKPNRRDSFTEWRTWAIVNWVLGTANRAATICDVQIKDIDFKRKEIELGHTKNKKAQIIPLSSSLETAIKEYIRMWRKDVPEDSYLFCNIGEEKLTTNALRIAFAKYCRRRGIEQTNIHGLRHNFAKGWVKSNGNMFALQKVLGHSTLEMTKKYVKMYSEDLKEDFDKFATLDNIKRSSKRTHTVKRSW